MICNAGYTHNMMPHMCPEFIDAKAAGMCQGPWYPGHCNQADPEHAAYVLPLNEAALVQQMVLLMLRQC